ncbi:MAG: histone deacetylase family protein [Rhodospirillaceae bacterium]|nr:histone deacetylase family protein [Rhodospirillaceae bacterium]MBT4588580.1 histone deacetylase family protein [Rhodospirillaceae bacterium]MBT4937537.1 histone deacetylase family protein [Rhodospirillaceae bacterium]MBT5941043.1 histone deacetylase family protein [Rhodospirillaceae bacterium]MBT7266315.1 histone deacetylase family protein [Rhodospirillaceae bacterium]
MTTHYYQHPVCITHEPGPHHPESPDRLRSVEAALSVAEFADLVRFEAPETTPGVISLMHDPNYVDHILRSVPKSGYAQLDPDTILSPGSGEAALRAVGGICAAVDDVVAGPASNAFCALRPPGHHAERAQAMGFCLFNNIAIAAQYARKAHGLDKIAVIDFDVHHGNGTQHMFEPDASLFYGSSHQFPAYPGTGAASETGVGNVVNVPLSPGSGSEPFRAAYRDVILPALRGFSPELLLISAGFDAHIQDPLCQLNVTTADFAWITEELLAVADECCAGRVVSTLEGGYDLDALAESVGVHVEGLLGE